MKFRLSLFDASSLWMWASLLLKWSYRYVTEALCQPIFRPTTIALKNHFWWSFIEFRACHCNGDVRFCTTGPIPIRANLFENIRLFPMTAPTLWQGTPWTAKVWMVVPQFFLESLTSVVTNSHSPSWIWVRICTDLYVWWPSRVYIEEIWKSFVPEPEATWFDARLGEAYRCLYVRGP